MNIGNPLCSRPDASVMLAYRCNQIEVNNTSTKRRSTCRDAQTNAYRIRNAGNSIKSLSAYASTDNTRSKQAVPQNRSAISADLNCCAREFYKLADSVPGSCDIDASTHARLAAPALAEWCVPDTE